jgi:hypothetical protein
MGQAARAGAGSAHATYDGIKAWRDSLSRPAAPPGGHAPAPALPPLGVAVFAADTGIRRVMERDREVEHWSEFDRGGHFPAMEDPDLLTADLRAFFRRYRVCAG